MPRASAPASQLAFSELSVRNYGLFANHFLEKRLPSMAEWLAESARVNAVFAELGTLYKLKGAAMSDATNEAQTENDWIQPVLGLLWGQDCYQVQVNLPNSDGRGQPDYALFTSPSARDGAEGFKGALAYWSDVAVVGDAKKWGDSLDKTRKGETPGAQISRYLFQTNKRWGILTNGRVWRLYEQDKARSGGTYYEVDLETILQSGDRESFKSFYFFFRREAFAPSAAGISFIEEVFKGSAEYAAQVGEGLKESVYDALRHLMNGFFDHPANALDRHDAAQLQRVHDTALIVLYRLLFILFAEDRGLLPCEDALYKSHSLRARHKEINTKLRLNHPYLPQGNSLWAGVCDLCVLIDGGLEIGGRTVVPAYNGGLFSAAKHPDIAPEEGPTRRWRIGDAALTEVIDRLAYTRDRWDKPGRDDIDYSSLEVQNLGSIYEGLLELQPLVAPVALVEVREGGKTLWKPQSEVANPKNIGAQRPRRVAPNEIYLATNKGERKATGSYYTPKYIVDYIVEQTVGPLAERAAQRVAALKPAFDLEMAALSSRLESGDESARLEIERAERALLSPYLELRVLDPAMGSGHFLVGAADYLSFAMATDPSLPALLAMGDEEAQAFYKRLAVEHCLYGVDLNPLAVELAKLSLWLHTVSKSRALSFLDHHLHTGNSLIGAGLDRDLAHEPPRLNARGRVQVLSTLFVPVAQVLQRQQLSHFLEVFAQIADGAGGDAEAERAKDALYRAMDALRDRYRGVANLWLAPFFGVAVSAELYQRAVQTLGEDEGAWQALTSESVWLAAQEIAAQKRFFHWHLEFPEVFLNPDGLKPEAERGFDAVIGNPPYGVVRDQTTKTYIQSSFSFQSYQVDYYTTFMENCVRLSKFQNQFSMIVPNTWLLNTTQADFRDFMIQKGGLRQITNYRYPVFAEAVVDTCIFFGSTLASIDELVVQHHEIEGVQDSYCLNSDLVAFL